MDPPPGFLQCLQQSGPWEHVPGGEGPHPLHGCMDGDVLWGTIFPPPRLPHHPQLLWSPAGGPSWPTGFCTLPADIPIVRGGFDLLGSPIGPSSYCEGTVLNRVKKVQEVLARLPDLQDSQMETTLLRSCLALPKVAFALRTCPPSHIKEATTAFDNAMREALSDLAGAPCRTGPG